MSTSSADNEAATSIGDQMTAMQKAQEKDQEEKKIVVIDAIKGLCTPDSCFEHLRNIGAALQNGDQLIATIIAGGKTNFSYKLHLEQSPNTAALYAKIAFDYALWNIDRTVKYDLKRMDNEFCMMNKCSDMTMISDGINASPIVATPYAILDLSDNSKLMVTQWATADEQFCNQFIEGQVDKRVISKVAKALAKINLTTDFDLDFNDKVRYTADNMFIMMKEVGRQLRDDETMPEDKCVLTLKQWSLDKLDKIVDGSLDSFHIKEVLCHADAHVFNTLVEKKPDSHHLEAFGPNGDFVFCDWETSSACSKGRDTGVFLFFPIACALCHAVQGHRQEAYAILDCLDLFWDTYAETMVAAGGKDETYLRHAFRNSLGICGVYLFLPFYILKFFQNVAPLQGVPEADAKQAIGSSGYIGLKFMDYGFGGIEPDLTLEELRNQYKEIIHSEVESMLAVPPAGSRPRPRRPSILRESGRRVSDASVIDEETMQLAKRFSAEISKRRSSVLDPLLVLDFVDEDEEQ